MFSIPAIPTDNVYKFRAISGVVVALFFAYQLGSGGREMLRLQFERQEEANMIAEITAQIDEGIFTPAESEKRMLDLLDRQTQLRVYERTLQQFKKAGWWYGILNGVGLVVGVIIAYFGFGAWYDRVQRHQDTILMRQAALRHSPAISGVELP